MVARAYITLVFTHMIIYLVFMLVVQSEILLCSSKRCQCDS